VCQNNPTKGGVEVIYKFPYLICKIYSRKMYLYNGKGNESESIINKENTHLEIFLGGGQGRWITCTPLQQCVLDSWFSFSLKL
jgi:hypothetical protein